MLNGSRDTTSAVAEPSRPSSVWPQAVHAEFPARHETGLAEVVAPEPPAVSRLPVRGDRPASKLHQLIAGGPRPRLPQCRCLLVAFAGPLLCRQGDDVRCGRGLF